MQAALEVVGVTKTFGPMRAVDDLHLVVPRGSIYGIIGPSGAGKTTAVRLMLSILFPDSGTLTVLGKASALEAKDRIGYLPEERGVYRKMKVGAFVGYLGQLKGVPHKEVSARASRLLGCLGLAGVEEKKLEDLSKGMVQRVQFVGAIINQPDLIILDEPFSGLDPVSVKLLKELIAEEHRRGATILFSTHIMAQAEEMCQHVVMIHKGRKVLDEPMSGLARRYDTRTIRFEPFDIDADVSRLRVLPGVTRLETISNGYEIGLAEGTDPAVVIRSVVAVVPPARIELARVRLEDVFIRLVTEGSGADAEHTLRADLQEQNVEGAIA